MNDDECIFRVFFFAKTLQWGREVFETSTAGFCFKIRALFTSINFEDFTLKISHLHLKIFNSQLKLLKTINIVVENNEVEIGNFQLKFEDFQIQISQFHIKFSNF